MNKIKILLLTGMGLILMQACGSSAKEAGFEGLDGIRSFAEGFLTKFKATSATFTPLGT